MSENKLKKSKKKSNEWKIESEELLEKSEQEVKMSENK